MRFNDTNFFNKLRAGLLGPNLDTDEVEGCQGILIAAEIAKMPISWAAYVLATAYHETQGRMCGKSESLNYSAARLRAVFGSHRITAAQAKKYGRCKAHGADFEGIANAIYGGAWGAKNLGNICAGDGFKYIGRGAEHVTGRANYQKVDDELGLGGELMDRPAMLLEPVLAGKVIVSGMARGRYRSGRDLARYIPRQGATMADWTAARSIINPDQNGKFIARYAWQFEAALRASGWGEQKGF
jgi:putative chitinase